MTNIESARTEAYTRIEQHAERAKAEIRLMGAMARKHISRIAAFDNRSKGQKRRFAAIKQGDQK